MPGLSSLTAHLRLIDLENSPPTPKHRDLETDTIEDPSVPYLEGPEGITLVGHIPFMAFYSCPWPPVFPILHSLFPLV